MRLASLILAACAAADALDVANGNRSGGAARIARAEDGQRTARNTTAAGGLERAWITSAGPVPSTGYSLVEPQVVDYRNDEPSRLRRAGLLVGALPLADPSGTLATGHLPCPPENPDCCTFDIDCDDGDPCTTDRCEIETSGPLGAGACLHQQVPAGSAGGCDDGQFCNGLEHCDETGVCAAGLAPMCCAAGTPEDPTEQCSETLARCSPESEVPGRRCTTDGECPGGSCDHCVALCSIDEDCDDGLSCNGFETCVGGVCQAADPICGSGANCFENRCIGSLIVTPCVNDDDCDPGETCGNKACTGFGGGPCEDDSDCDSGQTCESAHICRLGRCCPPGATADDCLARTLEDCLASGGQWYAGDTGEETATAGECGGKLPVSGGEQLGCPAYSSGISQSAPAAAESPLTVGPVSLSPQPVPAPEGPGVPLERLGDDYELDDDSHLSLVGVRLIGGMIASDAVFVELWDDAGNFIEDVLFHPSRTVAVNVLFLSPPLTIPPRGRISIRNKVEFAPNARFVWASAAATQQGANNPDTLFVNDDPQFSLAASEMMGGSPGILSFELLGRPVSAPVGGCCHGDAGVCTNEVSWVCRAPGDCVAGTCVGGVNDGTSCAEAGDCRGLFLEVGSLCAACRFGGNEGTPCQTCQGGGEPGDHPCAVQSDCDLRGLDGTCLSSDAVCDTGLSTCSNSAGTPCTTDGDCAAVTNTCSNLNRSCVADGDCPPGGTCGGGGTCEAGVCAVVEACGVGACCLPDGSCQEDTTEASCSGDFQGSATSCDPNCCPAPVATGKDDCADVAIGIGNIIPTLGPSDPPVVLTFTGDNSTATSTADDPDRCFGEAGDVDDDRGWWEGFALTDTCTRVRVDLCCSIPVHFANWPWLTRDCDCTEIVPATLDPNAPELADTARGAPFCNEDNLWLNMGLLPAGNYYYSIRSALAGTLGPYTMHVVAEPCPDAACCLPSGACVVVNQLECAAAGGFFLAPPNKFPATSACVDDPATCQTGACCAEPGECVDQDFGDPLTEAECEELFDGSFIGGMRCHGGVCAQDDRFSCSVGNDCVHEGVGCPSEGSCCVPPGGDDRALSQPSPCPICEQWRPGQCQSAAGSSSAISELSLGTGIVHADDFIPGLGFTTIDQLCVWGTYFSSSSDVSYFECPSRITSEDFRVRIYRDNGFHLPGELVGESSASSLRAKPDSIFPLDYFLFQLTLNTPITGLVNGEIHWLEVANDLPVEVGCFWSWSLLSSVSGEGNNHMAGTSEAVGYAPGSERQTDVAWCLPGPVTTPPTPLRPACGCSGDCFEEALADSQKNLRSYQIDAVDAAHVPLECSEFVCPSDGTPANDDFENALEVPIGFYTYETFCASTDGLPQEPSEIGTESGCEAASNAPVTLDMWFQFTAAQDCTLVVSQCAGGTADTAGFDAILGVYTNGTGTCPDPRTAEVADATRVHQSGCAVLSDEDCCAGNLCGGPGFVEVPALEGQCFTIRAAAFAGQGNERGRGVIDISCGPAICGDGRVNTALEECDGPDVAMCPLNATCSPPGAADGGCRCVASVCGNGVAEGGEECDGVDDERCPGNCLPSCECSASCGNNLAEPGEDCDGTDDADCRDRCQTDCTCPPKFCGNDFVDPGEECDGAETSGCSQGTCRPPADPAGECTCACGACQLLIDLVAASSKKSGRFISAVIPDDPELGPLVLEVELASLYRPDEPLPVDPPDYSALEGQTRYVRLFRDAEGNPITQCLDSPAFQTTYHCATLGCEPQAADWAALFGGEPLYISGDAIVPDSRYLIRGVPPDLGIVCRPVSVELSTARWGDANGDDSTTITDVVNIVDRVKDVANAAAEPAVLLHPATPAPHLSSPSVLDVTLGLDALKLFAYPYSISPCP